MTEKFIALTTKLTGLFHKNTINTLPQPPAVSLSAATPSIEIPEPRYFFTKLPEGPNLLDKFQKAKQDYLPIFKYVPSEGQDLLSHLETDLSKIPQEGLHIQHRLRLKNLTELVLPRIFKEYSAVKTPKIEATIPADAYFVENLKIVSRQVEEIIALVQQPEPTPNPQRYRM